MALSRVKVWIAGEVLTATDLNSEYNNILGNPTSLVAGISPTFAVLTATGLLDLSGASAGQVQFPATQNPSSGANTLDDYEEATYTPAWTSSGSAPSIGNGTLAGYYVKIGQMVWATVTLVFGNTSSAGTGVYSFTLPFTGMTLTSGVRIVGDAIIYDDSATTPYIGAASFGSGATTFTIQTHSNTTMVGAASPMAFTTLDYIQITIVYRASA